MRTLLLVCVLLACGDDDGAVDAAMGDVGSDAPTDVGTDATMGALYDRCLTNLDCTTEGARCELIMVTWDDRASTGSRCATTCAADDECPMSTRGNAGLCVDFGGTGERCYETCSGDEDCADGYRCGDFGFVQMVCLPY